MTLQDRFEMFHAQNPHVYKLLVDLARQVKARGFTKYSINSLFERARWHYMFETTGDVFKLNNNYRSRYTRLMQQEPDLAGMFATSTLLAAWT